MFNKQAAIDYIKSHIANYQSIKPFEQPAEIIRVKEKLFEAGIYKQGSLNNICDSSIINLLLKAQGKSTINRHKKKEGQRTYI